MEGIQVAKSQTIKKLLRITLQKLKIFINKFTLSRRITIFKNDKLAQTTGIGN